MARLTPTPKQVDFARRLGIDLTGMTAKQLSVAINAALVAQKENDQKRIQQAENFDMLGVASTRTRMKKGSVRYQVGPCPKAGCSAGRDGFVVDLKQNSWFCRKCDAKGSPIGFLMHVDGLSFWEAVDTLAEGHLPTPTRRRELIKEFEALWPEQKWQQNAQRRRQR